MPWRHGDIVLAWREVIPVPRRLGRALLALPGRTAEERLLEMAPLALPGSDPTAEGLAHDLGRYLAGEIVTFPLQALDMAQCGAFQVRVLEAEHAIPRGSLSTYGRIAAHIGHPGAARAVGTALGTNPFPVLIPCHRAVRTDGSLGGYAGGLAMKRALLSLEGITVSDGRAPLDRFVY